MRLALSPPPAPDCRATAPASSDPCFLPWRGSSCASPWACRPSTRTAARTTAEQPPKNFSSRAPLLRLRQIVARHHHAAHLLIVETNGLLERGDVGPALQLVPLF